MYILNAADVLAMTADELRSELQQRGVDCTGSEKPALQAALLASIGFPINAPPPATLENSVAATPPVSDPEIEFAPTIAASLQRPTRPEAVRAPDIEQTSTHDDQMSHLPDMQLQLRRLELKERRLQMQMEAEDRREQRRLQAEAENRREQRQHELDLCRLELEAGRVPVPAPRPTPTSRAAR